MSDVIIRQFFHDTAACLNNAVYAWLAGTYGNLDTYSPFDFTTHLGYRAITLEFSDGVNSTTYFFVNLELAAEETMPLRALLSKASFNPPFTTYWYPDPGYWEDFDNLADHWEIQVGLLFYEAIDQWTTGTSEEPSFGRITTAGGKLGQGRIVMPCLADSEATCYTLQLYAMEESGDVDVLDQLIIPPAPVSTSAVPTIGSTELARIVQALNDIAHKTTVTQLNNNGAIAVLDSGEIITP